MKLRTRKLIPKLRESKKGGLLSRKAFLAPVKLGRIRAVALLNTLVLTVVTVCNKK